MRFRINLEKFHKVSRKQDAFLINNSNPSVSILFKKNEKDTGRFIRFTNGEYETSNPDEINFLKKVPYVEVISEVSKQGDREEENK